jgi:hypothetical protein
MPVIVTHDNKTKKKKKKPRAVSKSLLRKGATALREMKQQGILKGDFSRGGGFDPLPNIRVGKPKKEKYTWSTKKSPTKGGSDWRNLTKSERIQQFKKTLKNKKSGGKITYKMSGGQVVDHGYE